MEAGAQCLVTAVPMLHIFFSFFWVFFSLRFISPFFFFFLARRKKERHTNTYEDDQSFCFVLFFLFFSVLVCPFVERQEEKIGAAAHDAGIGETNASVCRRSEERL